MNSSTLRMLIPHTSLESGQPEAVRKAIAIMSDANIKIDTFDTNMKPIAFRVEDMKVCDPEMLCAAECQNLPDCKAKQ